MLALHLRCGPNFDQLLFHLLSETAQLCLGFIVVQMDLSYVLLVALDPLVQSCEATVDLVDVAYKVNASQTLVLNRSHHLLLVLNGLL